jgi:heme/copper-type cytochrome/quinol oxidase subunit 2
MPYRLKKFIGMLVLVALVVIYALVATAIASHRLAESAWYVHLAFFAFSGVFWVVPAMFVISWMERRPRETDAG